MANSIKSIALDKLVAHPDNPNRQSGCNFAKLVRNIERTGRYEPLVVRPLPERKGHFQIINGYHRCRALAKLGFKTADCVVWDVDDEQTDVLLATLNRLGGSDELGKKLVLLKRLNKTMCGAAELAKLVPQTAKQIERLTNLKRPVLSQRPGCAVAAEPMVFFLDDLQRRIVTEALKKATGEQERKASAVWKAEALARIGRYFLDNACRGPSAATKIRNSIPTSRD